MTDSLASILAGVPDITMEPGHSGYFSRPQKILDPALFEGDHLKRDVAVQVAQPLTEFWRDHWYERPTRWATVWLAGSGISYQWAGDRGNGDLDVLIGVDTTAFKLYNSYSWGEAEIDDMLTSEMREDLWPRTANTNIGGKTFEVTYFVNRRASDIRAIHPYAAYNLSTDSWTVRPPKLPANPESLYPQSWFEAANRDAVRSSYLVSQFNQVKLIGRPGESGIVAVLAEATRLFNDIHTGRGAAFGFMGEGYGDYANFRWQAAKQSGAIGALSQIVDVARKYHTAEAVKLYGGDIRNSEESLRAAMRQVMEE